MTRRLSLIALAAAVTAVAACVPKRIVWSPDGQRALVTGDNALYLCDADGKLSSPIGDALPQLVTWLPDSRRFVAVAEIAAGSWQEVAPMLTEARREEIIRLADKVRQEILAHEGNWDDFEPGATAELTHPEQAALGLYIREHRSEGLPEKMGDKWDAIKDMTVGVHTLMSYTLTDTTARPGAIIARSLYPTREMRVSPDGNLVACVEETGNNKGDSAAGPFRLSVVQTAAGAVRIIVADHVGLYPDWSPDGQYLVYISARTSAGKDDNQALLGSVTRRQICNQDGSLLETFEEPETLASALFSPFSKTRCLADGRVLFSSTEVHLPCAEKDMPEQASLFAVDPGRQATVTRVMPRQAEAKLPDGLAYGHFEVSPDAARVAITGSKGEVAVLTLATGDVTDVQPTPDPDGKLRTVATWRSADELCFLLPAGAEAGSTHRAEIALWSNAGTRIISKDWPSAGFKELLGDKEKPPQDQPDSRPE